MTIHGKAIGQKWKLACQTLHILNAKLQWMSIKMNENDMSNTQKWKHESQKTHSRNTINKYKNEWKRHHYYTKMQTQMSNFIYTTYKIAMDEYTNWTKTTWQLHKNENNRVNMYECQWRKCPICTWKLFENYKYMLQK